MTFRVTAIGERGEPRYNNKNDHFVDTTLFCLYGIWLEDMNSTGNVVEVTTAPSVPHPWDLNDNFDPYYGASMDRIRWINDRSNTFPNNYPIQSIRSPLK